MIETTTNKAATEANALTIILSHACIHFSIVAVGTLIIVDYILGRPYFVVRPKHCLPIP